MYFAAKRMIDFVHIYTVMGTVFTFVLCSLFRVYFPQKVSLIVHIPFTTFPAGCSIIKSQQGNKSPAVNLLKPQITVNTLTSLLPLSQRKSPGAVMKTVPGLFLYYMYYWMRTSKTVSSLRLARISRPNSSFLRVKCSRSPS